MYGEHRRPEMAPFRRLASRSRSREGIMGKNVANYLAFFSRNWQLCSNLFSASAHFQIKFGAAIKMVE
jgi:hypothetical protein